jgi:hypothetical protein
MKTLKEKREVHVEDQRKTHLPDTLEFLTEDVQHSLMVLTDLSIALERERLRLDDIESDNKIPLEEVRVTYSLLTVLHDKFAKLSKDVDKVVGIFNEVLVDNDLNPIIAETWARSNSQPLARPGRTRN